MTLAVKCARSGTMDCEEALSGVKVPLTALAASRP